MSIKSLKSLKKTKTVENKTLYIQNLIIGDDISAFSTFVEAKAKLGDKVSFLSFEKVDADNILSMSPSTIRGEDNINYVKQIVSDELSLKSSTFYKEGEFRKFNSRAKNEPLLWGEEFFVEDHLSIGERDLFLDASESLELLEEQMVYAIEKIECHSPTDLIDEDNFTLTASCGTVIKTKKLIWGKSPYEFLKLCKNKDSLSNEFIQFCEELHTPSTLRIIFTLSNSFEMTDETLFIPLSYTHEWGHFIGEFKEDKGQQKAIFNYFIDPNETNEADLAKKIKLLKRNLCKIFDGFEEAIVDEYIVFDNKTGCLNIDDKFYGNIQEGVKNLVFIGFNAPLVKEDSFEYSCSNLTHLTRAHASTQNFLETL